MRALNDGPNCLYPIIFAVMLYWEIKMLGCDTVPSDAKSPHKPASKPGCRATWHVAKATKLLARCQENRLKSRLLAWLFRPSISATTLIWGGIRVEDCH